MCHTRRAVLLPLLAVLLPLEAHGRLAAQETRALAVGTRVRVAHASACCVSPQLGTLVSLNADSLVLRPDGSATPLALPRGAVRSVEYRRRTGSHIVGGAVVGLLVGGVAGAVIARAAECDPSCTDEAGLAAMGGGATGALGGAVVGAIFGAIMPRTVWRRAELPPQLGFVPGRRGRFEGRLALAF